MEQAVKILCASAVDPYAEDHTRYLPLWPAYLSAYLTRHMGAGKVKIEYFNGDLEKDIRAGHPDVVALSSVTQNYGIALDMARTAKSHGLPVVIGGMHISSLPRSMSADTDVACLGEGEETFCELMRLFVDRGEFDTGRLAGISGIAYHREGEIVRTRERPLIELLDDIPHPDRRVIGYGRSRDYLYTARGCSYRCVFCASNAHWKRVRYASARYVLEEIQELVDHGVRTIRFNDDNLPANGPRLREIAAMVVDRGIHRRARFSCWARANDITEETVRDLKAMNVVAVVMGLESGNDRVLAELKGAASVDQNRRAVNLLRDARIQTSADFIIGAPDETEEEIMDTERFIRKNRLDFVTVNVFSPLPGTPVWELAERRGLVSETMDFRKCTFKFGPDPSSALMLSERLTHERLWRVYRRLKRLALVRSLMAIPGSPWVRELPGVLVRKIAGKLKRVSSSASRRT